MHISRLLLSYQNLMYETNIVKKVTNEYWKRGSEIMLSYVNFNILCNITMPFTELIFDFLKKKLCFLFHMVQENLNKERVFLLIHISM